TRRVGGGHAGGALLPLHFGIGARNSVEMRVIWPDGKTAGWEPLEAGARVSVERTD
ncbi:MAG: ASPIC/UnbV domain-containing protein, partial [Pseudomonadota bacterium]